MTYHSAATLAILQRKKSQPLPMAKKRRKPTALAVYLQSLSPSGRRAVQSILKTALQQLHPKASVDTHPWHAISYTDLMAIKSALTGLGYAPRTINLIISAIRGIVRTAFYQGEIPAENLLRLNAVKTVRLSHKPSGRALSKAEVRKLLKACQSVASTPARQRNKALLLVALSSGLRVSELQQLNVNDICRRTGMVSVRAGKGGKFRQVMLSIDSRRAIAAWLNYLSGGENGGAVWRRVTKSGDILGRLSVSGIGCVLSRLAQEGGVQHLSPHDLRRTYITTLLETSGDINLVRQLAGHADIGTTARYDRRDASALTSLSRSLKVSDVQGEYKNTMAIHARILAPVVGHMG